MADNDRLRENLNCACDMFEVVRAFVAEKHNSTNKRMSQDDMLSLASATLRGQTALVAVLAELIPTQGNA